MSKIISQSAELNCPPQKAFEMFTNTQLLGAWLCDRAEVEAVVGGKYELFWNPPPENAGTVGCRITAMEQVKFLAFGGRLGRPSGDTVAAKQRCCVSMMARMSSSIVVVFTIVGVSGCGPLFEC